MPFHPLHSHIREEVSHKPRCLGASVVMLEDGVRVQDYVPVYTRLPLDAESHLVG